MSQTIISCNSMPRSGFFLVTPCLVVAVQPCMEWIPIKKKKKCIGFYKFDHPYPCMDEKWNSPIEVKSTKILNEFSICNYLNVNTDKDKDFIEDCIWYLLENTKLKNKPKNGISSYFKIYLTDPAILNDSDFSNKLNDNIRNDLTGTQSNEDLIEALKSKLLDKIMPYIKTLIKEELELAIP